MNDTSYLMYLGKICPYCKTEFIEGDEIVVCSECEMPHHKECFIENKGCTTFGCQGSMKSLIVSFAPIIDIKSIENEVEQEIKTKENTENSSQPEIENLYAEKLKECIYNEILFKMSQIKDVSNNVNDLIVFNKLIIELEKLGNYRETNKKIKDAIIKRNTMGNYLLNTTRLQIDCTDKISLVRIGLKRYLKIKDITNIDVSQYQEMAEKRIRIIEKENQLKRIEDDKKYQIKIKKLEKEKIEEENHKNSVKKAIKFFISIVIVLVCIFSLFKWYLSKKGHYDLGLNHLNEGSYAKAIIEFENSRGYAKSDYYVDYCNKMLHYIKGKEYVEMKQYSEALIEFEQSIGIEDTEEFIEYCKEQLNK